jgi:hypothetical protein
MLKTKTYFPPDDYLRRNTADNFSALYPRALEARMGELNNYANFVRSNQSPYVSQSFESLMNAAPIQAQQVGQTDIGKHLQSQALSELGRGSALSPEDQRVASQSANAAYAARGMGVGQSAAAAEVLNRYHYGQQRLAQRQQFGLGVDQQDLQRQQFNSGLQLSADQTNKNFMLGRAAMALQGDPARTALHGPTMVTPSLGISADMANTTYNAGVAQHIAAQNREAALRSAQMQSKATRGASNKALWGAGIGAAGSVAAIGLVAF